MLPWNSVQCNYIGTDVTGTLDLGNGVFGVVIGDSSSNDIGGTPPGAGNLISGNDASGIRIETYGGVASGKPIQGNYIGTDATGTLDLGNSQHGVHLTAGENAIGGRQRPPAT